MSSLFLVPVEESWMGEFNQTVRQPIILSDSKTPPEFEGHEQVRVWGTTDEGNKRTHFEQMSSGDPVFFYHDGAFFAAARVIETFESSSLGDWIWDSEESKFIFTLTNFEEIDVPVEEINSLLGYAENNIVMGFGCPSDEAISNLLQQFNSIEETFQYYTSESSSKEDDVADGETGAEKTREHVEIQWHLIQLGLDQGYDVYVAKDERTAEYDGEELGQKCIDTLNLTGFSDATMDIIEYVDVIWLDGEFMVEMFEVEHTTSIYSGILRMTDFVVKVPNLSVSMNIVAPGDKEDKVRRQINRPSIQELLERNQHSSLNYQSYEKIRSRQETVEQAGPLQNPL